MDDERARELLERERTRVEKGLADLRIGPNDELSDLDQHLADDATDLFEEERDEGLAQRLQEDLDAIARAEKRLEEGKYGMSVDSGEPIPDARLEAQPWAERTVEEQERYDHGG